LTDPFHQPAPGNAPASGQNGNADWSKTFITPSAPEQTPAQAADMAEFRKLLEPSQPVKTSRPSTDDGFFPARQTSPGHPVNPAGIGNLPGVAGQSVVPPVTAVPDWKPQPPPWRLQGPQPDKIPKRVVF